MGGGKDKDKDSNNSSDRNDVSQKEEAPTTTSPAQTRYNECVGVVIPSSFLHHHLPDYPVLRAQTMVVEPHWAWLLSDAMWTKG